MNQETKDSKPLVIVIMGLADGTKTLLDGSLIVKFDVDANNGVGKLFVTKALKQARKFKTLTDAIAYAQRVSKIRPLRPDGKPNRPLMMYNVAVIEAPDITQENKVSE